MNAFIKSLQYNELTIFRLTAQSLLFPLVQAGIHSPREAS